MPGDTLSNRIFMQNSACSTSIRRQRVKAALVNLYIGDALSMPVHWFYNPVDILRSFPPFGVQDMQPAPLHHPSSIMSLHSTRQGGRIQPGSGKQVVGDVILKGRRQLWGKPNTHYHHALKAGENTLNTWCARLLMNGMTEHGHYEPEWWAQRYIDFMTADPPQHPDTYAESYHREFFSNLVVGKDPLDCGAVTHDTPSMGALVTVAPLSMALLASQPLEEVQKQVREHVRLTHPDEFLMQVVDAYVALLSDLLNRPEDTPSTSYLIDASKAIPGSDLASLIGQPRGDAHVVGRLYSLACYIKDSWPCVCYLAEKYQDDASRGLLVNTNLGGENAHRGSVLGTLLGLSSGTFDDQHFKQLHQHESLEQEIEHWVDRFYPGT